MNAELTSTEGEGAPTSMFAEYEEQREKAVQTIKGCIQALRDKPHIKDEERWGLVQTIHLFWKYLPDPYSSSGFELDIATQSEFDTEQMEAAEDGRQPRSRAQVEADVKARLDRQEADAHANILAELGTTDDELTKLCGVHGWGFYPYELAQATSEEEWQGLHDLRRSELFVRKEGVVYNTNHPDDHAPNHFPLVLKFHGKCIGTARLDLFENGEGAIRLVAIEQKAQRQGHGRVLEHKFEELARSKGVSKLFVNANPTAIGYYEKLGFVREDWVEPSGSRSILAKDCVQMAKTI